MVTSASGELIKRAVPPLTLWMVARLIEVPKVRRTLRRVDAKVLRAALKRRWVRRRLLRVVAGVGFFVAGGLILARSARLAAA
jgi:hypothetical protein